MEFLNLTPHPVDVLEDDGDRIDSVQPSGKVGIAAGEQLINVPPPEPGVVYIVLPAVTDASDRDDLVSIEVEEAQRSRRGNVQTHVCYWNGNGS